ncbi:hypothetical protein Tco_1114554 [Tanacetum coccineum]|uniref:Uncharacterized protein n=1 Tax=Tanacetum coccineum TaxID=301880 RepID=A0ABQ5IVU2_9ASTR
MCCLSSPMHRIKIGYVVLCYGWSNGGGRVVVVVIVVVIAVNVRSGERKVGESACDVVRSITGVVIRGTEEVS